MSGTAEGQRTKFIRSGLELITSVLYGCCPLCFVGMVIYTRGTTNFEASSVNLLRRTSGGRREFVDGVRVIIHGQQVGVSMVTSRLSFAASPR